MHGGEFAIDNRPVWFLVDHHGPDPVPIPDPPVVWYTWTGTDLLVFHLPSLCCLWLSVADFVPIAVSWSKTHSLAGSVARCRRTPL
jgi:hypothetical protein